MHPYWNQTYVDYWKEKCLAAELEPGTTAHPPSLVVFGNVFRALSPKAGERVLDVGVGFGRMIPVYRHYQLSIEGVDISREMIEEAAKNYPEVGLQVSEADKLSFADQSFDLMVCWGTFDTLLDQQKAIGEFGRCLKSGGRLLVTGKNRHYREDDEDARLAEIGARKKGHPNTFTEYDQLLTWAEGAKLAPIGEYFFEYRGDTSLAKCKLVRPEAFYEYYLLLQKI